MFFYRGGFVPDESQYTGHHITLEYGSGGVFRRQVANLLCMFRRHVLLYDGIEDGMYRYSLRTMVGWEVYEEFELSKLLTGYGCSNFIA